MDMKSISGLTCYVHDIASTTAFYEALGFRLGNQEAEHLTVYVNWFWIKFITQDTPTRSNGQLLNIKVADVNEFHVGVVALGLNPESEPLDLPSGNREFVLVDPDGHKLVFFEKI